MTRVGVLSTIPEAPVKPLMQDVLAVHTDAVLVNPPAEHLDAITEDALAAWPPESFDRIIHDGDWPNMSKFSQEFIAQALASGALIQIVNGRKGEK